MAGRGGKRAGAGRKPGKPTQATLDMKAAMYEAFEKAGGATYLAWLAKKEPRTFGTLLGKLIPNEIKADVTGDAFRLNINLGKDEK